MVLINNIYTYNDLKMIKKSVHQNIKIFIIYIIHKQLNMLNHNKCLLNSI